MSIATEVFRGYGGLGGLDARVRRGFSSFRALPQPVPTGRQYQICTTTTYTGDSMQIGSTPPVVVADVFIPDLLTTPSSYSVIPFGDGTVELVSSGDTSRQKFTYEIYRQASATIDGPVPAWIGEVPPSWGQGVSLLSVPISMAIVPLNLAGAPYATSASGDMLVFALASGGLPPGLSVSPAGLLTGVPSLFGSYSFRISATDLTGMSTVSPISQINVLPVGPQVAIPNVVGLTQLAAINALTAAGFTINTSFAYMAGAILGNVSAQSPAAGTPETLPFTVSITIATAQVWPRPSPITNLPGRGCWELPGGQQGLWVFGNSCYLMTIRAPATGSSKATFVMHKVGQLLTTAGPVCIRDNGPGGYAFIVDGPYGYLYNIASKSFKQITDPGFLGADRCAFIDGWMIFNWPGTQTFYTTGPVPYTTTFPGSFFALKDAATDKLVSLMENKEELWLIGERTTEIWYDAGGQYFAFQRLVSTMIQTGCAAKHSIARFSAGQESGLCWLANSERGENVVVKTSGFATITISTPAISSEISKFPKVDDAIGYVYTEGGHEFYMLIFPTADVTFCFDFSTDTWHRRASYDPYANAFHRHRSNCFMNFQDQRLVGDYQNGSVYNMSRSAYTDAGWPLVAQRRTPVIWDGDARQRVFLADLQLDFAPGVGNQTGFGSDPQAILKISRDAGQTYGPEYKIPMGRAGNYLNRAILRRLGFARNSVMEVTIIEPVNRDIVGATLRRLSG